MAASLEQKLSVAAQADETKKPGRIGELWQRLMDDHKSRSTAARKQEQKQIERETSRVAKLVD